jgi:hypothetical protein
MVFYWSSYKKSHIPYAILSDRLCDDQENTIVSQSFLSILNLFTCVSLDRGP